MTTSAKSLLPNCLYVIAARHYVLSHATPDGVRSRGIPAEVRSRELAEHIVPTEQPRSGLAHFVLAEQPRCGLAHCVLEEQPRCG